MMHTNEGGLQFEHSLDHNLEFFSKAGSMFVTKNSYYYNQESALSLFQKSWVVDKPLSMKLLLWLRDCRSGAGNRSGARECYKWLAEYDPEWLIVNIGWLPLVGRWDDLRVLFGTKVEDAAAVLWTNALKERDVLAAKWADRSDYVLRRRLNLKIGDFRRMLAKIRKDHIVEHKMCIKCWNEINYESVPSVAMARYTKAFGRNDEFRFNKYKAMLKKTPEKIHADVLFPHDCVRTVRYGDTDIADAQFAALPNFLEGTNERIIVLSDTSNSMRTRVAGQIQAKDISQGLALYCSAKIPKNNPFHKKFIAFCSESEFKNWNGMSFSKAVNNQNIFDRAIGTTQIDTALDLILKTAKFFNLNNDQLPTTLLIVSDMQFHPPKRRSNTTPIEDSLRKWDKAGYKRPKIIYWNTDGYAGSPAIADQTNVGLISGFSPAILKAIFEGKNFDPISIMYRTVEKYDITLV